MLHIDQNALSHTASTVDSFDQGHLLKRLRHFIREELANYVVTDRLPTIGGAAKSCYMSVRALQRKLADQGSSFSSVLAETQSEMAIEKLTEKRANLITVALDVGYTDQSNFSRAFRRWFGMSPKSFRTCDLAPECKGCKALSACLRRCHNDRASKPCERPLPGSITLISKNGDLSCQRKSGSQSIYSTVDGRHLMLEQEA